MKHAPGPYETLEVGSHAGFHCYITDCNGRKIGVAWGPHDEKVWTAALFAAAPDLLEAAVRTIEENLHLADGENCTLIHLKRAIAKATGAPIVSSAK